MPSAPATPAAEPVAEIERQLTPPEVADPRDPDGEDIFFGGDMGPGGALTNVVGAKFRATGSVHAFDAGDATYARGDEIVVDTDKGPVLATVTLPSRRQPMHDTLRRVMRRATETELRSRAKSREKEREIFLYCKEKLRERGIPIKLTRVELPLSPGRVVIYFASEERVDFRDLVKGIAHHFSARVEMRQLGARDEAKLVGGIGACGRELCCSTWLPAFVPISIKMAKDQGLVLNPSKLAGQCGRLKCCLVYEHDTYKEMARTLPKVGKRIHTPAGNGKVIELDVLAQRVRVWFDEGGAQTFPGDVVTLLTPPPPGGASVADPEPTPDAPERVPTAH